MGDTIGKQIIDFCRFVKHRINTQLRAPRTHFPGGIVAQKNHLLPLAAQFTSFKYPQAASAFQEEINDRQVPPAAVEGEPFGSLGFRLTCPDSIHRRQFFKQADEVATNDGVVFDQVCVRIFMNYLKVSETCLPMEGV